MNIENKNQLNVPNILFGFFDFIFLIFRNKKLFLIFFIITLFINLFIFFIYDYKSLNFGSKINEKYYLNTQIQVNSRFDDVPINFLENELIDIQELINEESTNNAILDTFNSVYLLNNFFYLLSNEDIIHEVLMDLSIIDNNTDQSTVNDLIIEYSNRINNEYIKNESETITGVDIKFEIDNIDSDKVFIKNLIIKSNEKVSEQFFVNLEVILKILSNKIKHLKQNPLNQLKAKEQLEMNNQEIKSLKLHYKTALSLNIIKPKILTTGEAYLSYSNPLFFNLGTEILSELIKSKEEQLISELVFNNKKLLLNIQSAEDNLNELIKIIGINNQDRFSFIHFDHNIIKSIVEKLTSTTKQINYLLYLFVLFLGLLSFIGTILVIDNYKKYKLN